MLHVWFSELRKWCFFFCVINSSLLFVFLIWGFEGLRQKEILLQL